MDAINLDDNSVLSADDLTAIQIAQDVYAQGFSSSLLPDGTQGIKYNVNGSDNHVLAGMDAAAHGGRMSLAKYMAAVHDSAEAWGAAFDGHARNRQALEDAAFREVNYEGVENIFGGNYSKNDAEREIKHEISRIFDRMFIPGTDEKTNNLEKLVPMEDINRIVNSVDTGSMSAFGRLKGLYTEKDKEWEVSKDEARASADLFNLWEGKRYDTEGKLTKVAGWKEQFLKETGKDKNESFYDNAPEFALWAREKVFSGADAYQAAFRLGAKEEILTRLIRANAHGELSQAEELEVIYAVTHGKDGGRQDVAWDDPKKWPSHITPEDIDRLELIHKGAYREAYRDEEEREAVLKGVRDVRDQGAQEAEELGLTAAAKKAAEKKAKKEAERKAKEEEMKKSNLVTKYGVRQWSADADLREEPMASVEKSQYESIKKELLFQPGDKLYVHIQKGNKKYTFPVKAYYTSDKGNTTINLSPSAVLQMKGARAKKAETEGNDNIRFYVERAKR